MNLVHESTINLPFLVRHDPAYGGGAGFAYIDDPIEGVSCYGSSLASAKKALRRALTEKVFGALKSAKETRRSMIGTKEGSIMLVEFRYGGWGYAFYGPGRKHAGGGTIGLDSFEEAVEKARSHAETGFGGISWEHSA